MGKIIVPKNHVLPVTNNYNTTISTNNVTLDSDVEPTFTYTFGDIIVEVIFNYTPTTSELLTTNNVVYRVNLFHDSSIDDKDVRFIKLTLNGFPIYRDNRTGTNYFPLTYYMDIHKKPSSITSDCTFMKKFGSVDDNRIIDINGTYWLTLNPSTRAYSISKDEPVLISKAIVPNKDNWMDFDTVTEYSPSIEAQMAISTGQQCNQPYIGRMIKIRNKTSNITISASKMYNLIINTADKILGISSISLGKFIGTERTGNLNITSQIIFNIFINDNSTAVYTMTINVRQHDPGERPFEYYIGFDLPIYIDVANNKTITEDKLSKAIDTFPSIII